MAQEFTNALQHTPLWQFALRVYPPNHHELLTWQNEQHAQVNDLIAIAFCIFNSTTLPIRWWQDRYLIVVRQLIIRTRDVRSQSKGTINYELAKRFELNLEGLDILLLQQMMISGDATKLASAYELHLGIKKGALAPLIKRLVN